MKIKHHSRKSKYSLRSTRQHAVQVGSKPLDTSSLWLRNEIRRKLCITSAGSPYRRLPN